MQREEKLELIRRFAPVLKLTRGERFYPMSVDEYLRVSSLWARSPNGEDVCLVPQGELDTHKLGETLPIASDAVLFIKFIEPVDFPELLTYLKAQIQAKDEERFHPGEGRLARVGYLSRFVDLLFSLSLLARGRVSGDTSMAAALEYERIAAGRTNYPYYARVIKQKDWLVLQYWYFFAFNNWRSGYFGVNDHEADWEMVNIYLSETAQGWMPEWLAFASHDFSGDDLRRHWLDPEIQKVGEHPVAFVGAGSHASYFQPGEYLMELDVPFLSPVYRMIDFVQKRWQSLLGLEQNASNSHGNFLRIPFVDYARGDGNAIGEQQTFTWDDPVLLDPEPRWVTDYRGLWGLYAQDPASGENAPAGPMYQRNGSIRKVWFDPIGWAGLDKVPTEVNLQTVINRQKELFVSRQMELQNEIEQMDRDLEGLGVTCRAITKEPNLNLLKLEIEKKINEQSRELGQKKAELASIKLEQNALERLLADNASGATISYRDHIRRAYQPTSQSDLRASRLAEWWAAASVALLLFGFVLLMIFSRQHIVFGTSVMIALFVFIESGFRRTLPRLINSLAIGLAAAAGLLIVFHYFWYFVVFLIIAVGFYILLENLRELVSLR